MRSAKLSALMILAAGAAMAGAAGVQTPRDYLPRTTRRPRRPMTPAEIESAAKRREIDEWNAEIDRRKAEKKARRATQ